MSVKSNVIPANASLKLASIRAKPEALFQANRTQYFYRGQLTLPAWLKREANGQYFTEFTKAADLEDLELFLSGRDENFSIDEYNTYATGTDVSGRNKIQLLHTDENDTQAKVMVMVVPNTELAMLVLALVDKHCGDVPSKIP